MALFRNLGVKLRVCLCDVPRYASTQPLVFLDLAENCSFLNWKLTLVPIEFLRFVDGHYLVTVHGFRGCNPETLNFEPVNAYLISSSDGTHPPIVYRELRADFL